MKGRRIGIDIRALTPPMTGTGVYLREILRQLAELAPDNDYFCYTTRPAAGEALPRGRFRLRVGEGLTARWGTLWLQTGLLRQIRSDRIELFWGPLQVVPLPLVGRLPTAVTLHDLVFQLFPETMSWRNRLALPLAARRSLQGADAILAVSRATAEMAVEKLGVQPRRLHVIHHAAGPQFEEWPSERAWARVGEGFGLAREYLLFVGTHEPRKNLDGLLRAVDRLIGVGRFDGDVVLVGTAGWKTSRLLEPFVGRPLGERIRSLGYVDDRDLAALYSAARLLVMPSHYEGFGLPILEAMRCGAPVVCSDRPPFPEIAGGAALRYDAGSEAALAEAIAEVWSDEELRRGLAEKGRLRAREFSWRRSGATVLEVFERLLRGEAGAGSAAGSSDQNLLRIPGGDG